MPRESLQEAEDWLKRAERDLLAAEQVVQPPAPLTDVAVYHCQQAAEKAMKGFLVAHGESYPKVHDLVPLVGRCQSIDQGFSRFLDAAQTLTPYAVRFRYPGGPLEPDLGEAREALELAREVFQFVRERLAAAGLS